MRPTLSIAIVGGRDFDDYPLLESTMDFYLGGEELDVCIVSGGAKGADTLGKRYADEKGLTTIIFVADWNTHGKSAGYKRNVSIVKNSDAVIAFWDGKSKGTKHTIDLANKADKPVLTINY